MTGKTARKYHEILRLSRDLIYTVTSPEEWPRDDIYPPQQSTVVAACRIWWPSPQRVVDRALIHHETHSPRIPSSRSPLPPCSASKRYAGSWWGPRWWWWWWYVRQTPYWRRTRQWLDIGRWWRHTSRWCTSTCPLPNLLSDTSMHLPNRLLH